MNNCQYCNHYYDQYRLRPTVPRTLPPEFLNTLVRDSFLPDTRWKPLQSNAPYTALISPLADPRYFEEDPDGKLGLVLDITTADGTVLERAAWRLENPARWRVETGALPILGLEHIKGNYLSQEPVLLVATPAEYLAAKGNAICILDWDADLQLLLAGIYAIRTTAALRDKVIAKVLSRKRQGLPIFVVAS